MKFKKILIAMSAFATCITPIVGLTTSCSAIKFTEKKDVKMLDGEGSEILTTNLLYKEGSTLALIGLKDTFPLVEKMYANFVHDDKIKFTITRSRNIFTITRETGATCVIDADNKTFTFKDYTAFIAEGTSRVSDMIRDYGGYKKHTETDVKFVAYGDFDVRVKSKPQTVFDLSKYEIPMYLYNDDLYLPVQTVSDIFLQGSPICALKDILVPIDTIDYPNPGVVPTFPDHIKNNALEVTQELLNFNYAETCFFLDITYGLKAKKHIDNFDTLFNANTIIVDGQVKTLKECMLTSIELVDEVIDWTCGYICDDGHTRYLNRSPSNPDTSAFKRIESVSRQYMNSEKARYTIARDAAFPSGFKQYALSTMDKENDTAIIRFDKFNPIPDDFDKTKIPDDPNTASNAIGLFSGAYKKIASDDNIENVIVDISCNGGGDVRFAVWLASMLNAGEITGAHCYTADNSINICSYYADCNFDGVINGQDQAMKTRNVYVLTSTYSFSCANTLPTLLFDKPNVKVIGKTSGGGACFVYPATNVFGTHYRISGAFHAGHIKNGTFYSNDEGIDPTFFVPDSLYYKDNDLCAYIKNFQ